MEKRLLKREEGLLYYSIQELRQVNDKMGVDIVDSIKDCPDNVVENGINT